MAISFRINQNGVNGTSNRARRDIELSSVAGDVTFEALSLGYTKYLWEILSCPIGASKDITNPTGTTVVYEVTHRGGYLIRLTVDDGLVTQEALVLYFGVPLENSGLVLPAQGEVDFDNSQFPYDGKDGQYEKLDAFYAWIDANATGSGDVSAVEAVSDEEVVASAGVNTGSVVLGIDEGVVWKVMAEVTAGASDDADVEFGDSSFSGSPTVLYQIGRTLSGPIWDPDTNGNWVDRNAWGVDGLTDGVLHYRITNNGSLSVTIRLRVKAQGVRTV